MFKQLSFLFFVIIYSPVSSVFAAADSCERVHGMHVTDVTTSSATLQWDHVQQSEGYLYVVSKSQTPPEKFGRFTKEPRHKETGLAAGATYYAHVRTSCSGSANSRWVTAQFNTPAMARDRNISLHIFAVQVYPSTAELSVTVKVKDSDEETAAVTLYNMWGEKIKDYTLAGDRLHIEVNTLPPSIYYVRYNDAQGRIQTMRFTRI